MRVRGTPTARRSNSLAKDPLLQCVGDANGFAGANGVRSRSLPPHAGGLRTVVEAGALAVDAKRTRKRV
jgi:hypothetical protein